MRPILPFLLLCLTAGAQTAPMPVDMPEATVAQSPRGKSMIALAFPIDPPMGVHAINYHITSDSTNGTVATAYYLWKSSDLLNWTNAGVVGPTFTVTNSGPQAFFMASVACYWIPPK